MKICYLLRFFVFLWNGGGPIGGGHLSGGGGVLLVVERRVVQVLDGKLHGLGRVWLDARLNDGAGLESEPQAEYPRPIRVLALHHVLDERLPVAQPIVVVARLERHRQLHVHVARPVGDAAAQLELEDGERLDLVARLLAENDERLLDVHVERLEDRETALATLDLFGVAERVAQVAAVDTRRDRESIELIVRSIIIEKVIIVNVLHSLAYLLLLLRLQNQLTYRWAS